MKSEKITAFALAISLGVVCADFTNPLRASAKCNKFDITCNPHIKPITKPLAEQAWGEAGAVAYPAAANVMLRRNIDSKRLSDSQKRYLRPHFGDLVDRVVVTYGSSMMDQWGDINLSGVDTAAQTYCNRIYIQDSYKSDNTQQLVTLAHEMTHSKQCEELGGEGKFGFHYFREFKRAGLNYENNKLEREAYSFEEQFAGWLRNQLANSNPSIRYRPGFYSRVGMNPPGIIYLWPSPWDGGKTDVWCDIPNHDMYVGNLNNIGSAIEVSNLETVKDSAKYWSKPCSDDVFQQSRVQH